MSGKLPYEKLFIDKEDIDFLVPLDDMVLVRIDAPAKKTAGGIIMASDTVQKETAGRTFGILLKLGPKVDFLKDDVSRKVVFNKFSGDVVFKVWPDDEKQIDGYELRLMPETSVKAVIRK